MIELHDRGFELEKIQKKTKLDIDVLEKVINDHMDKTKDLSDDQKEIIKEKYMINGNTIEEISKIEGISIKLI